MKKQKVQASRGSADQFVLIIKPSAVSSFKNFVDITFPFTEPYHDNLCFHKIAQVPGQQQFNHHFRMHRKEDVNDEVLSFMKLAYTRAL